MILVSPAEPPELKAPNTEFVNSPFPEALGCDFICHTRNGLAGVQRKEFPRDFISSLYDGRLQREIPLMKCVPHPIFMLEGRGQWTSENRLMSAYQDFSKAQLFGLLFSIHKIHLIPCVWVDSLSESAAFIRQYFAWCDKPEHEHESLSRRPGGGKAESDRAVQEWIWQGFPGIGPRQAKALVSHFGGLPMAFTASAEELAAVKWPGAKGRQTGMTARTIDRLMGILPVVIPPQMP